MFLFHSQLIDQAIIKTRNINQEELFNAFIGQERHEITQTAPDSSAIRSFRTLNHDSIQSSKVNLKSRTMTTPSPTNESFIKTDLIESADIVKETLNECSQVFETNQHVNVMYTKENKIYPATILEYHEDDNTYDVRYDDGDKETHVLACNIQKCIFDINQRVNVRYTKEDKLYPATILAYHENDHSYDVQYDDDYKETRVSACNVQKYVQLWSCSCDNPDHSPKHTLARFVIFQRDLGLRLRHQVSHYRSILPYDSLVIINHVGTDQNTLKDLKYYADKGAHVWNCTGDFHFKGDMWTAVTKEYQNVSDFLFPLDGDEYLTIFQKDANGHPSLSWTYEDLEKELWHMNRIGEMGKPFKMLKSLPFPSDCDLSIHLKNNNIEAIATHLSTMERASSSSPFCEIQYTSSDIDQYCYNKCAYRGDDFIGVDSGNHGLDQFVSPCRKEYGFSKITDDAWPIDPSAKNNTFNLSNLTLVHLQLTKFSDYLEHGLRGTSDYGINKYGFQSFDCDDLSKGDAYCKKWNHFLNVSLDYYKLKTLYQKEACEVFDPEISYFLPIHHIFTSGSSC